MKWIIVNINRMEMCITTNRENSERERGVFVEIIALSMGGRDFVYFGVETPF